MLIHDEGIPGSRTQVRWFHKQNKYSMKPNTLPDKDDQVQVEDVMLDTLPDKGDPSSGCKR